MSETVNIAFLRIAHSRLVVHLTGQIRSCLDALNNQQIWWRPNETSNSIGNLVLHCVGSTRHYIGHVVGGRAFVRDRNAEFTERTPIAKEELCHRLDEAVEEADQVLKQFNPTQLLETTDRTPKPSTYMQVISLQLVHYSAHTGQIVFATKLVKADAIDDIWRKTPTH